MTRRPSGKGQALRRPWLRLLGLVVMGVVLLGAGLLAGRWYLRARSLAWQVRHGLALLEGARTPAQVRAALDRWEDETRPNWEARTEELIAHLYADCALDDQPVRLLLTRVAGADYGTRREDWQRWYQTRRRLRAGSQPDVPRAERVKLERRWSAPVGLTAWFTTIIPLDGQIYVASLGSDFNDPQDAADGVVRVSGATGAAELLFTPPQRPGRGPRDVIGVAAGTECLLVACYNGVVYCIDREGRPRWEQHVVSPVVGPPLATDFNRDGVTDVIVVTRQDRVVALSGRTGREAWVATLPGPTPRGDMLGATLALGDVLPSSGDELLVTTALGEVAVLAVRDGRLLWRHDLAAGTLAGSVCRAGSPEPGPPAYVGDRSARLWSLVGSGRGLTAVGAGALSLRRGETLIAALRTLRAEPEKPPLLIACPTGDYAGRRGAVCALEPEGLRWRLAVGGAVWGTPVVADLNADHKSELVVASIDLAADESIVGVVTIVSQAGHCLRRLVLDAPIECSPVVADVDGDGHLEVLVADQSGLLHCFGTGVYGPVEWGLFGGDSHNTRNAANAFAFGQVPFNRQWHWRPE